MISSYPWSFVKKNRFLRQEAEFLSASKSWMHFYQPFLSIAVISEMLQRSQVLLRVRWAIMKHNVLPLEGQPGVW